MGMGNANTGDAGLIIYMTFYQLQLVFKIRGYINEKTIITI